MSAAPAGPGIALRRAYEAPGADDSYRVLVDRFWPRGRSRAALELDEWARELAPTGELIRWFGHAPECWDEFRARYLAELAAPEQRERCRALLAAAGRRRLTLVYGARNDTQNQAVVLREALRAAARRRGGKRPMKPLAAAALSFALLACSPAPMPSASGSAPPSPSPKPAGTIAQPAFVDRDWRVESSSAVAPGTTYRFGADGTLRIESPGSPPAQGRWTYDGGRLVMVEEGIAYPADILALDAERFSIRSYNPGEPVEITMVAADPKQRGER